MSKILELREKRAKAWDAAKAFLDAKRTQEGFVSAEDAATYDKMEADVVNLGKDYYGMDLTFAYNADGNLEDLDFGMGGLHYTYGDASLSTIPNTIDPAIALHLPNFVLGKEDAALAFLLNKTGNVSKKIPNSLQIPVTQDETTGELIYETYAITATMNNNVLSIDCGNALDEVGVPNIKITYEK